MEFWQFAGIILGSNLFTGVAVALLTWFLNRNKSQAETTGVKVDNTIKTYNYANDLFNKVVELREKVDELLENNKLLNFKLNEEIKIRINCEERLTALEEKIKKK